MVAITPNGVNGNTAVYFSHLVQNIDEVFAVYDLNSNQYDFVSKNVQRLYGFDVNKYGKGFNTWKKVIHPDDLIRVEQQVKQIILTESEGELLYRINTATGEEKMVREKLLVKKGQQKNSDKLYIVKTDCTNLLLVEQSLVEAEKRFRFISENLSDFISIHDTDWNFTFTSPAIKNILGFEPSEVLGMGVIDLVHPEDLIDTLENCIRPTVIERKETSHRFRMITKHGSFKWVETYSKPVADGNQQLSSIICCTRDVSSQVDAEIRLRESEEQYRVISENSNDLIGLHNLEGEFLYVSPSCRQILGFEPSELLGRKPEDVFTKNPAYDNKEGNPVKWAVSTQTEQKFIKTVLTKNGEEKLLEVWLKPVYKAAQLIGLQSASRDVTERENLLGELKLSLAKERELNELREKFVATASHQFRTPLTVIQSGVEIMDLYVAELPEEKQSKFKNQFRKIQEEVQRLEHLMNDILLLGRANAARTPFSPVRRSLLNFCRHIVENKYNNRYPADRQVLIELKGKEVPVSFDLKLLSHTIENILNNAYKYSFQDHILLQLIYEKNQVCIFISDRGLGIPQEEIKNLFQPFYRATNTNEIEGTGLGLSIVKEFVEKHGGKIFLESKLNKGTTVSVILPVESNSF